MDYREKQEKLDAEYYGRLHAAHVAAGASDAYESYTAAEVRMWPAPMHGDTWGNLRFNEQNITLEYWEPNSKRSHPYYYIDIERCRTSALLLDYIFQIANKTWMTTEDRGHLLEALQDLLNPQGTLCSCGVDRKFNPKKYLTTNPRADNKLEIVYIPVTQ